MSVTALVMAGGKGTRLMLQEEKPLLQIGGKPVIEYVLTALRQAKKVNSTVVAVSKYTPKTTAHLAALQVQVVKTPGKEYVFDMGYAVKTLNLQTVLAIAADLPLITGEVVDDILEKYVRCGKPALMVAVPLESKQRLGLGTSYAFEWRGEQVVPAGINVIDGCRIDEDELDQEVYVLDKAEVAVNINTLQELQIAENQFAKASK